MSKLLTTREVSLLLDKAPSTIARMAQRGVLRPTAKAPGLRGALLFDRTEVERLLGAPLQERSDQDDEQDDDASGQEDAVVDPSSSCEFFRGEGRKRLAGEGLRGRDSSTATTGLPAVPGFGGGEGADGGGSSSGGGLRDAEALPADADGPGLGAHREPDGTGLHALSESQFHDLTVADAESALTVGGTR